MRLLGEDAFARTDAELARYRNQKIGFIFQDHHLLPQCDVLENVLIPALAGREPVRPNRNGRRNCWTVSG